MTGGALTFCGREAELETLISRWRMASEISEPRPQLVTVKGERGAGKTRLVAEFYRWLSANADLPGEGGYWPDRLAMTGSNIEVNPDVAACRFEAPIPFLWWGVRAGDPGTENGVAGDAIATYDKAIAPHLVPMLVRARMKNRGIELAKVWHDVGANLLTSALQIDTMLTIGKGLFETARIVHGGKEDIAAAALMEVSARPVSRSQAILEDLGKILNPKSLTYAATPAVIFFDDVQFAAYDAALPAFIAELVRTASAESWPLLVVATHWRHLPEPLAAIEPSFEGLVRRRFAAATAADGMPAIGADDLCELGLLPIDDLGTALSSRLPGLAAVQADAILARVGGNPRFLEQIIAYLEVNEHLFEDFDPRLALTEDGLDEALAATVDIGRLVLRRLAQAPIEVQEALCLASLQGVRFDESLVDDLGETTLGRRMDGDLAKGEDPLRMISRPAQDVAAFSERLFHEVAATRRRSLKSLGGEPALAAAFAAALGARLDDPQFEHARAEDRALTYALAVNLFATAGDESRHRLFDALGRLAALEQDRSASEAARGAAMRYVEAAARWPDWVGRADSSGCFRILEILNENGLIAEAEALVAPLLRQHREDAQRDENEDSLQRLSATLERAGDIAVAAGDFERADALYAESFTLTWDRAARVDDWVSWHDLAVGLRRRGTAAGKAGDYAAALKAFEECLPIARRLCEEPDALTPWRNLKRTLDRIGWVHMVTENYPAAEQAYQESLEIARRLNGDGGDAQALDEFRRSLVQAANLATRRGDAEGAVALCVEGLDIARALVAQSETPLSLDNLRGALTGLGDAALQQHDLDGAGVAYAEALDLARRLETLGTHDVRRDLASTIERVGIVADRREEREVAAGHFREAVAIMRELAERLQTSFAWADLANMLGKAAGNASGREDHDGAIEMYDEALRILHVLAEESDSTRDRRNLGRMFFNAGEGASARGDIEHAKRLYDAALDIDAALAERLNTPEALNDLCLGYLGAAMGVAIDDALTYLAEGARRAEALPEPVRTQHLDRFREFRELLEQHLAQA